VVHRVTGRWIESDSRGELMEAPRTSADTVRQARKNYSFSSVITRATLVGHAMRAEFGGDKLVVVGRGVEGGGYHRRGPALLCITVGRGHRTEADVRTLTCVTFAEAATDDLVTVGTSEPCLAALAEGGSGASRSLAGRWRS